MFLGKLIYLSLTPTTHSIWMYWGWLCKAIAWVQVSSINVNSWTGHICYSAATLLLWSTQCNKEFWLKIDSLSWGCFYQSVLPQQESKLRHSVSKTKMEYGVEAWLLGDVKRILWPFHVRYHSGVADWTKWSSSLGGIVLVRACVSIFNIWRAFFWKLVFFKSGWLARVKMRRE